MVGLHLRWHGVWQRPNHILSRLKEHAAIVVVEEEIAAATDGQRVEQTGGIVVVTPQRVRPQPGVDRATLAEVRSLVADRSALLWLYSPLMSDLVKALPDAPIVYDKMDELSSFKDADPSLTEREAELCTQAVFVFAGGRSLWESVKDRVRAGGAFPSGVDVKAYTAAARERTSARSVSPWPVFGYIGVIDERLDLELISDVARARPDAIVVMVGPVAKIDPASLPQEPNIRYLGKRPYSDLPAVVASFDVALMPFARNEATRYISPTKTLEYLAARRPVVSTAVPDVVADFGDVVYLASDTAEFVAALARAERGDPARREAGTARADAMTWDAVFASMCDALARAGITFRRSDGTEAVHGRAAQGFVRS